MTAASSFRIFWSGEVALLGFTPLSKIVNCVPKTFDLVSNRWYRIVSYRIV